MSPWVMGGKEVMTNSSSVLLFWMNLCVLCEKGGEIKKKYCQNEIKVRKNIYSTRKNKVCSEVGPD